MQHWSWYVVLAGIPSWIGLSLARLHPALALCFVVPLLPSKAPKSKPDHLPTLHAFEHTLKAPVDFGLFLFTAANAGVNLREGPGPMTLAVVCALIAGKLLGVSALVLTAHKFKIAPLNKKMITGDVAMVASMASIGLTVALFVAGIAFQNDARLQGQAKLGALLSGLMGFFCIGISEIPVWKNAHPTAESPPGSPKKEAAGMQRVPTDKLTAAPLSAEDSYVPSSTPAAQQLGHRQQDFYKHRIRAGDNGLAEHPDKLQRPSLFSIDPEASMRARGRWQRSLAVLPLTENMTKEEKEQRSQKNLISFMQKQTTQRLGGVGDKVGGWGAGAGAAAGGAGGVSDSASAAPSTSESGGEDGVVAFVAPAPDVASSESEGGDLALEPATAPPAAAT